MKYSEIKNTLNEISKPNTRGLMGHFLKSQGYEKIGSGSYASVWGKPDQEYILKIFDNDDVAYMNYLKLIQKHSNSHFPILKGKPAQINEKYSGVRLERLKPINESTFKKLGLEPVYLYLDYKRGRTLSQDDLDAMNENMVALEKSQPGITEALDLISENFTKFDFRYENVMMRGNTVVLTDPVF